MLGDDHKIMCGDSTSHENVITLFGKKRATLLFTDPPYGIDLAKAVGSFDDSSDTSDRLIYSMLEVGKKFALTPRFFFLILYSDLRCASMKDLILSQKLRPHQVIIWNKGPRHTNGT